MSGEPVTEAGRALLDDICLLGPCEHHGIPEGCCWRLSGILAIEAEAVRRDREALVERVARNLCWATTQRHFTDEWWDAHTDADSHRAEARRLLGLEDTP